MTTEEHDRLAELLGIRRSRTCLFDVLGYLPLLLLARESGQAVTS